VGMMGIAWKSEKKVGWWY